MADTTLNVPVRRYTDLDFSFARNPVTDDVSIKKNEESVKQSLRNLVLTRNYEVPFQPEKGSPVYGMLFELFTPITKISLEKSLQQLIEQYEPRVNLIAINVDEDPDNNAIQILINFLIVNTTKPITLSILAERTR